MPSNVALQTKDRKFSTLIVLREFNQSCWLNKRQNFANDIIISVHSTIYKVTSNEKAVFPLSIIDEKLSVKDYDVILIVVVEIVSLVIVIIFLKVYTYFNQYLVKFNLQKIFRTGSSSRAYISCVTDNNIKPLGPGKI